MYDSNNTFNFLLFNRLFELGSGRKFVFPYCLAFKTEGEVSFYLIGVGTIRLTIWSKELTKVWTSSSLPS